MGCRRRGHPDEFVRLAVRADGTFEVGRTAPGRGVHMCSQACFDAAAARGGLARSLRRPVLITEVEVIRAKMFG